MASQDDNLSDLRGQIDGIDDALHDLILQRAALVARIRDAKGAADPVYFRPGREALILRRLLARHEGILPPGVVLRMWREMISAFVALQGPFRVAVAEGDGACWDLARDHFGSGVPMKRQATARSVVQAVAEGAATVGVVPMPHAGEDAPWWPLLGVGDGGVKICVRLPFLGGGNSRGSDRGALVVAACQPEETGEDRSFLVIDCAEAQSRSGLAAALNRAGLEHHMVVEAGAAAAVDGRFPYLVEIGGFTASNDKVVSGLVKAEEFIDAARSVGAYAALPGLRWDGAPEEKGA